MMGEPTEGERKTGAIVWCDWGFRIVFGVFEEEVLMTGLNI